MYVEVVGGCVVMEAVMVVAEFVVSCSCVEYASVEYGIVFVCVVAELTLVVSAFSDGVLVSNAVIGSEVYVFVDKPAVVTSVVSGVRVAVSVSPGTLSVDKVDENVAVVSSTEVVLTSVDAIVVVVVVVSPLEVVPSIVSVVTGIVGIDWIC